VNNAGIVGLSPIEGGHGCFRQIIAFSSSVLLKAFLTYGAYIAAKSGVEGLVHVLANELAGRNITVNGVAPGPTGTELFLDGKTEEDIARLCNLSPLHRLGEPKDIANVVNSSPGIRTSLWRRKDKRSRARPGIP
jgi:3-oxoacyl-[acyl-carrier protein] reductase